MSGPLGYPRLIEAAECSINETSSLRKIITLGRVRLAEIFTPVGFFQPLHDGPGEAGGQGGAATGALSGDFLKNIPCRVIIF
jgi:hypothetical protein